MINVTSSFWKSFVCRTFPSTLKHKARGVGDSHMKQTGMLVVSLRGVNFGFWSRLGCSGQSANLLCRQGLVQGSAKKHRITRRETEVKFSFKSSFQIKAFDDYVRSYIINSHCMLYLCVFKRSLLGVKICLSHAQIGLL